MMTEVVSGSEDHYLYFGKDIFTSQIQPDSANLLLVQLPTFILIFADFFYYCKFIKEYNRLFCQGSYSNLMLYPIILAVLWIPSEISFSMATLTDEYVNTTLMIICIALSRITGLINALVYGRQFYYCNPRPESYEQIRIKESWLNKIQTESKIEIERWMNPSIDFLSFNQKIVH